MFGYVTINKSKLTQQQYERFRGFYCGLCRVLKHKYGKRGQAFLNYDMTFLTVLLTALYEVEPRCETIRCLPNGGRRHEVLMNELTDYAADMNLALAYHKCMDDWTDEHKKAKKVIAGLLAEAYTDVKARYPRQCAAMERELKCLEKLEKAEAGKGIAKEGNTADGTVDMETAANCFGRLTAEIFVYREDEWKKLMWQMGFCLGKFIYLMDAYDDVEKDLRTGNYNPLKQLAGRDDFDGFCWQMFVMIMADCSKCFEQLPILWDVDILRNVLYSGVFTKYEMIQKRRKNNKANHK